MGQLVRGNAWEPIEGQSCVFPVLNTCLEGDATCGALPLPFDAQTLTTFCVTHHIEPSHLLRTAWAILLRSYTGCEQPVFSYIDHGAKTRNGRLYESRICILDLVEDQDVLSLVRNIIEIDDSATERRWLNTAVKSNNDALPDETKFSLVVDIHDQEAWEVSLWYQTSTLSEEQAAQVADVLVHITSELARAPKLSSMDLCSPGSLQQFARWNSNPLGEVNSCVHDLILEHCRNRPDAPAVCSWDGDFDYRDLDRKSHGIANHLSACGVGPDKFVGLYFEKSKWTTVALLAILRAGGAYVFLDPSFPAYRLQEMCKQVDITCILSSRNLCDDATALGRRVIPVDEDAISNPPVVPIASPDVPTTSSTKPHHAAYAVFTSGSTGTPKGAIVNHSSYCSGQKPFVEFTGLDCTTRLFQFASYAFDQSNYEHLSPLMVGGCICVPSEAARTSNIAQAAKDLRVNNLCLTPTVARLLKPSEFPLVETVMLLGEAPSQRDVTLWASHCRLINGYGPAECSVYTTAHRVVPGCRDPTIVGSGIGAHCWVTDLSDPQKLVPVGAIGELLIEGQLVGRCYVGDATKTEATFIESPRWRSAFPGPPKGRMYRTGDLVQFVSNGSIRYISRIDSQAKLRGQRLEMSEVEHHVRDVFGEDAQAMAELVIPKDSHDKAPVLVAFVHLRSSYSPERTLFATPSVEFRQQAQHTVSQLEARLPRFMVPSLMVELSHIPTTKTGKTDRRRLRQEASQLTRQQLETYTRDTVEARLPSSPMEHILYRLVQDVLQIQDFGMSDDFFHLGGDSVLAMELTRVAREAGIDLPAQSVLKTPVLGELALAMQHSRESQDVPAFSMLGDRVDEIKRIAQKSCGILLDEIEDIFPCTPLQEAMMALSTTAKESNYVIRSVFRLPRAIDPDKLQRAWDAVILANPVLRTRIVAIDGDSLQVVTQRKVEWKRSHSLDSAVQGGAEMLLGQPLLGLTLVQENTNYLVFTIHHSLCDGWSLSRTFSQVEAAYYNENPVSQPFKLFVQHLLKEDHSEGEEFWAEQLDGFSGSHFPNPPSSDSNYRTRNIRTLRQSITVQQPKGSTLAMVLTLAWALTTSNYSGSDDVVFGSTVAGRNMPISGIDQILGPTFATIPLRIKLRREATVQDMLQSLRAQSTQSINFEHLGLNRIKSLGAASAAACRFQNLLIIQPWQDDDASTIFSSLVESHSVENIDTYTLTMEAKLGRDGSVVLVAEHDEDVIPGFFMERIMNQFRHNLDGIAQNADKSLQELDVVNSGELSTMFTWNHQVPEAINCCVQDMIHRQALAQPNKSAVEAWDGCLTFAELDDQATRLAVHVQRLAGPGAYVMVYVGKSRWTVVAMLAVMKAGASFILVDPAQPVTRLRQIVNDTQSSLVIATTPHLSNAATLGIGILQADADEIWGSPGDQLLEPTTGPESILYAVFTSGSTGNPKGVLISHRAFLTSAVINGGKQYVDGESRVLQLASFTFDASIAEILYPLVVGGSVCIPSDEEARNDLEMALNSYEATWATLTPSVARAFSPSKLTTLKTLALGGEAMKKVDIEMWVGRVRLVNGYGPAESSVDAVVQPDISLASNPANIGRSFAGAAWIIDPDSENLVPIGAIGELVLEGPTLAQGYLNDTAKTRESFIEYPEWLVHLRHGKSGRIYRTGDLVHYSSKNDGTIEYVGRKDNQVKLRGQRIELGEIEHHLRDCLSDAKEILVEIATTKDVGAEPVLVAFVYFGQDAAIDDLLVEHDASTSSRTEAAETMLRTRLPRYMVPSLFLTLSRVPLTPTGKIDRRRLREEISTRSRKELFPSSNQHHLPQTTEELVLQKAASSVIGMPSSDFGTDDNFFHIGGDSIVAMKLVSRVREAGYALTVADVFTHPRLSDLAGILREDSSIAASIAPFSLISSADHAELVGSAAKQCGVDGAAIEDLYPCTPMQEALMASTMKDRGSYVARMTFKLDDEADIDRLWEAWDVVCESNAILRTRFVQGPRNELLQAVLRGQRIRASSLDPSSVSYGTQLFQVRFADGHMHLWMHHALYDGYTLPYILQQARTAYRKQQLQYSSYNEFIAYAENIDMEASSQFWRDEFRDMDAAVFPARRPRTVSERVSFSQNFAVPEILDSTFTLPTMVHLASALVFGQYTASSDVVYGLTLAGRNAPVRGIETIVGPTITTVPFRVQFSPHRPVSDNLSEIQHHLARLVRHEQMGVHNIRHISPETASACNFQCHLVIQPAEEDADSEIFRELKSEGDIYTDFVSYPLVLVYTLSADKRGLEVNVNFDSSCLDPREATTLLHQLEHVLVQIVTNQHVALQDVEVVSPHDLSRIAQSNNAVPEATEALLHELVYEKCRLQPDNPAIRSWDGHLSYGDLYSFSSRLAQHFTALDIGEYTIVCMEKSCWTIVVILAVLQAGSACAVMDPSHPPGRMQDILNQTGAKLVVVSPETQKLVNTTAAVTVVCQEFLDALPASRPSVQDRKPSDPCIVLFTSGSTGTPKGIVLEHRSLATSLTNLRGCLNLNDRSRVLHFASFAFDIVMLEIFGALTSGGCLCIPSEADRTDLTGFIQKEEVNWSALAASGIRLLEDPSKMPCLKTLVLGGEPLVPGDVDLWAGNLCLINAYGPAECSPICAAGRVPASGWEPGTIGPMVNGVGWVTEPANPSKLAAWGAVGELLVEGPLVAREYLGDPEKTAASFIGNPPWLSRFGRDSARLYRTGDLVQYNSDGHIRYVGRRDTQVKLRGQRIELGEIETQFKKFMPVGCAVIAELVAAPNSQKLCAFVCLGETADEPIFSPSSQNEAFQGLCREGAAKLAAVLPRYMIPEAFIQLNRVPLTQNGKLDRRRLVKLAEDEKISLPVSATGNSPSSEAEMLLAGLWAELLGQPSGSFGTHDNFFLKGGDSIQAMKLVGAARRRGLHLTVSDVFSHPQLSDMAVTGVDVAPTQTSHEPFSLMDQGTLVKSKHSAAAQCSMDSEQIEDMYPCSPLQEALVSQSMRRLGAYVGFFRFRLPSNVDVPRLQSAWQDVAENNPILRTRFVQLQSLYQVVVREKPAWTLVQRLDDHKSSIEDLRLGQPLMQLVLSQSGSTDFMLVMHHALYDGWSVNLILEQVAKAYSLHQLSPQPFNRLVHHITQSSHNQADYWTKRLAGCNGSSFPVLPSGGYEAFADSTITQSVKLNATEGATSATLLQLAWSIVLSEFSDSKDVVYGLVLSGRNADLAGVESVSGPTITTVPMRVPLNSAATVKSELNRLQEELNQMTPFEQFGLRNIKQLGGDAATACQFQNLLLIQPTLESSDNELWENPLPQERNAGNFSAYALEVTCEVSDEDVNISFDFDARVLQQVQAQRILYQFTHTIEQIQTHMDTQISQLDLLAPQSRQEIMQSNAALPEAIDECVHNGIKRQTKESPDAMAVCAWDGDFTYQELDDLAARLAIHLQSLGVGPEVYVPILAEKTRWVAVAIMGVIKAGGAIFLLDPAIPLQRLQTMCEGVDAKTILTTETCASLASQLAPVAVNVADSFSGRGDIVQHVRPDNALYVIFTSGSTGKPKGIVVEHRSFYSSGVSQLRPLYLNAATRTLQFASHMFDVSIADYLWTFLAGGCVCVASSSSLKDDLATAINDLGVNRADVTPSVARVLRPEQIPCLKTILVGGEPMSRHDIDTWAGKVKLVNGYGPTECSVCCIITDVHPQSDASNIGLAYGVAPWIVDKDDHTRLLPLGAIGELVLEGHSIARGYLGVTGGAASAFVEEPPSWLCGLRPRSRLYKTGDLVQYNADGTLRYIGRKDTQVKIRGQRVELGEIEHQIRQARPSIRDVIVELVSPANRSVGNVLTAFTLDQRNVPGDELFCPPSPESLEAVQSLVSALQKSLPTYMVPPVFIALNHLPLSPSGKADRRRLREQAALLSKRQLEEYQVQQVAKRPPSSPSEQLLQTVVAEVLRLDTEDIGMDDDFFRLGGDSIIALSFAERARASGFTFRVTTIFKTPKLADLALMTENENGSNARNGVEERNGQPTPPLSPGEKTLASEFPSEDIVDVLPVSQSTERYLLVPPEYWILNLNRPLNHGRLQSACEALVRRHSVLRSIFVQTGEKTLQLVLRQLDVGIQEYATTSTIADFVDQYRLNDDIPVPTLGIPITKLFFVRDDGGKQALVLRLSHSQFDGYCLHTLWRDLKSLYQGDALPDPADFSSHMKVWSECHTEEAFGFWRDTLHGTTISRIDNTTFGREHEMSRDKSRFVTTARRIHLDAALPRDVTMASLVKTAWALLLAQLTGQDDVVFAQIVNGRNNSTNAVGNCLNFSPVRVRLDRAQTAAQLMRSVQRQHRESMEFELLDFREIVKQSTPWAAGTLHQSLLVHQNIDPDLPFPFGDAEAHVTCSYHWEHPPDEILVESRPLGDGVLQLTLDTTTHTLSQENADTVLERFGQLIPLLMSSSEKLVGRNLA